MKEYDEIFYYDFDGQFHKRFLQADQLDYVKINRHLSSKINDIRDI